MALVRHGILLDDAISSLSYAGHNAVIARLRDKGCAQVTCDRLVSVLEGQTDRLEAMTHVIGMQAESIAGAGVCLLGLAVIVAMTWYATIRHLGDI